MQSIREMKPTKEGHFHLSDKGKQVASFLATLVRQTKISYKAGVIYLFEKIMIDTV